MRLLDDPDAHRGTPTRLRRFVRRANSVRLGVLRCQTVRFGVLGCHNRASRC